MNLVLVLVCPEVVSRSCCYGGVALWVSLPVTPSLDVRANVILSLSEKEWGWYFWIVFVESGVVWIRYSGYG